MSFVEFRICTNGSGDRKLCNRVELQFYSFPANFEQSTVSVLVLLLCPFAYMAHTHEQLHRLYLQVSAVRRC